MARRKQTRGNKVPAKSIDGKQEPSSTTTEATANDEVAKTNERATNDPEWYARDPRLLMDGANIPYNTPFGAGLDLFGGQRGTLPVNNNVEVSPSYTPHALPGICSLALKPSFGANATKNDPLNVCANALYTYVRYVNSGRKNYDPADLMIYAAVWGDIYSFIVWCQRIYQYAFMYSQRNYYVGKDLIIANRVDADNIISNLANFRYWINTVVNKVSSFCVPADIYYFKRRVFLYGNYYMENPYGNIKDQLYQFVPEGFYRFDFDARQAGKLSYTPLGIGTGAGGRLTLDDLINYFNVLMGNITGDEDFGLMSGDILKAYGIDKLIHLGSMGEDGGLAPVFDPYVLSQFKNASVYGEVFRGNPASTYNDDNGDSHVFGDLEQTTDGLLVSLESMDWVTNFKKCWYAHSLKPISVEAPEPGVGDTIEATRLTAGLRYLFNNYVLSAGTEIVVEVKVTYHPANALSPNIYSSTVNVSQISDVTAPVVVNDVILSDTLWMISMFKYCPIRMCYKWTEPSAGQYVLTNAEIFGNMDNTTLITNTIIDRLHEIALLSLFYVPGVAKLIS